MTSIYKSNLDLYVHYNASREQTKQGHGLLLHQDIFWRYLILLMILRHTLANR